MKAGGTPSWRPALKIHVSPSREAQAPAVLEMLGRFTEDLTALQRAIRWGDGDTLFNLFTRTRAIRREVIDAGQETPAADFGRPHGKG